MNSEKAGLRLTLVAVVSELRVRRRYANTIAVRTDGVVAQLVERLVRNEKVAGSIPVGSTMLATSVSTRLTENETRPFVEACPSRVRNRAAGLRHFLHGHRTSP